MSLEVPINVARHLATLAESDPHRFAVVFPEGRDAGNRVAYTHLTFAQLHTESNRLANAFDHIGIRRGVRTVLMVAPSLDFFIATFALSRKNCLCVPE